MVDIVIMLSASTGLIDKAIQYTRPFPFHAFLMKPISLSITTLDRQN
jgi:hypothetical protein